MPITARLLRPPEVRAGAQRRVPLWCVALHRPMLRPARRAAPSPADRGPASPRYPSSIWFKKNYNSVSQSHPTASTGACSAQGAAPASARPLSRLVPPPPALLTPCHGPYPSQEYRRRHRRRAEARRFSLSPSLCKPERALGECIRPARTLALPTPPSPSTYAPRQPAARPTGAENKTTL